MPSQEMLLHLGLAGARTFQVWNTHATGDDNPILSAALDEPLVAGPSGIVSAVACPLPAGGATFHLSRTMHYSQENTQKVPRRAFILGAACPSRPLPAGVQKAEKPWQAAERSAYSIGTGGYQRGSTENKDVFGTPKL